MMIKKEFIKPLSIMSIIVGISWLFRDQLYQISPWLYYNELLIDVILLFIAGVPVLIKAIFHPDAYCSKKRDFVYLEAAFTVGYAAAAIFKCNIIVTIISWLVSTVLIMLTYYKQNRKAT